MGMRRGDQRNRCATVKQHSHPHQHCSGTLPRRLRPLDASHGGRNECFLFGAFDEVFTDYDLEGAYSTALAAVVEPDHDDLFETKDPEDFTSWIEMGYAAVKWKFPADTTRFPRPFGAGMSWAMG